METPRRPTATPQDSSKAPEHGGNPLTLDWICDPNVRPVVPGDPQHAAAVSFEPIAGNAVRVEPLLALVGTALSFALLEQVLGNLGVLAHAGGVERSKLDPVAHRRSKPCAGNEARERGTVSVGASVGIHACALESSGGGGGGSSTDGGGRVSAGGGWGVGGRGGEGEREREGGRERGRLRD